MADNYTQFSFELSLNKPEQYEYIKQWVMARHLEMESDEWFEQYNGITLEFNENNGSVWIHDDGGCGDVEAAIYLVQSYLVHINAPDFYGVYFSWANTCSKPRLNEFSGGGIVVTRNNTLVTGSYDCCREASEAGIEIVVQ